MTFVRGGEDTDAARVGVRVLSRLLRLSPTDTWALTGASLGLCWLATTLAGGTSTFPPHAYYLPIIFVGIRFGRTGALFVAVLSGLLAGPMSWADVASRTTQPVSDWGARAVYFVVIGQVVAALVAVTLAGLTGEVEDLRRSKDLWLALDQRHLAVHFQPIVSMRDGRRIVGAEALLRWEHPNQGTVPPDEFIPLAERTGLIRPIGAWVLRESCSLAAGWREERLLPADFFLSVNVSARQLDSPEFGDQIRSTLQEFGIPPERLHLELTETAIASDLGRHVDTLHGLRRLGVRIALDDFGTGHSTLTQVQHFPVDVLKVDRSFVATIGASPQGSVITENVLALARSLGASTIAEGVETEQQAMLLKSMGGDLVQGYHFGRPCSAEEFALALAAGAPRSSPSTTPR